MIFHQRSQLVLGLHSGQLVVMSEHAIMTVESMLMSPFVTFFSPHLCFLCECGLTFEISQPRLQGRLASTKNIERCSLTLLIL